jgi:hypothetical protein
MESRCNQHSISNSPSIPSTNPSKKQTSTTHPHTATSCPRLHQDIADTQFRHTNIDQDSAKSDETIKTTLLATSLCLTIDPHTMA